jgi:hypothetical protein
VAASSKGEWRFFNNFTNDLKVVWSGGSTNLANVPFLGFRSKGDAFFYNTAGGGGANNVPPQRGVIATVLVI